MVTQVTSYKASDGSLHSHKRDAIRRELTIIVEDYAEHGSLDPDRTDVAIDAFLMSPQSATNLIKEANE